MWSTSSTFDAPGLSASAVWSAAYADASAWPLWNDALASASLDEPFAAGSRARVRFRTGLRLRFTLVEVEEGRMFTDESRLAGARMGHRHELEPLPDGVRLVNTIYIRGPLARLWAPILGPQAKKGLPGWQRRAAALAAAGDRASK
ncbi:MAG TPA: SRPBCC family protein [Conexibacter sp.]|nr:SRPBCC family protein [Conexibacter sp.]